MIFSDYFFSTKNHQKNWTFSWFFEILSHYMCISKTSSKKNDFRTSRISWKITKILKTLSENKHQVILYLYPYLFSQYSVTLFTFCAVPIVKTIHNFITLGNCSCKGWRLSTIMVIKYMDRRNKSAFEAEKHNWTARMTRFTQ